MTLRIVMISCLYGLTKYLTASYQTDRQQFHMSGINKKLTKQSHNEAHNFCCHILDILLTESLSVQRCSRYTSQKCVSGHTCQDTKACQQFCYQLISCMILTHLIKSNTESFKHVFSMTMPRRVSFSHFKLYFLLLLTPQSVKHRCLV